MSKQPTKKGKKRRNRFPRGWDNSRVQRLLSHYESMSDAEQAAEDDAAYKTPGQTMISVPTKLVPAIRKLIAGKGE
jgi:hypothetical protein